MDDNEAKRLSKLTNLTFFLFFCLLLHILF